MIKSKKMLMLSLAPISVIPLTVISCGGPQEVTYFEAENFWISSEGEIWGYADVNHKQFGSLIIKEEYNGVTIKSIRGGAFRDQKGIDNVVLPKTLIKIGSDAFQNIKSPVQYDDSFLSKPIEWDLSHLVDLEEIGPDAFGVDFPSNIQKQIKLNLNLSGLSKLNIIYSGAFSGRGISSINFDGVNNLETIGEAAFANNQLTSMPVLPSSITYLSNSVFEENQITSLSIPNTIIAIGNSAFESNQLTSLTLPNSIVSLGESVFSNNQLTNLPILPSSIINIPFAAFSWNKITSITLPNSIIYIGGYAFKSNELTSINIPDSVTTIGDQAFLQSPTIDLSQIKLPAKFDNPEERTRIGIIIKTPPAPVLEEIPVIKEDDIEVKNE